MANLPEDKNYEDGIYQIETTDPVLGGEDGIANKGVKQLANRTNWLRNRALAENVSVRVGPDEDYETINDALEYLVDRYYNPVYKKGGVKAEIIIANGFEMDEQVLVKDMDLEWIHIIHESAQETFEISNIEEGSEIQSDQTQEVDIEITGAGTGLHGEYVYLPTPNGSKHFYFKVDGEGELDLEEGIEVEILSGDSTSDVADKLQSAIDGEDEYSASVSDSTVSVSNAESGDSGSPGSSTGDVEVTITQEGQDQWNQAKFTTSSDHGFTDGHEIVIMNHYGEIEEEYYNGIWTIINVTTDSFELDYNEHSLDAIYDSTRAGTGDTGEVIQLVEVPVKRSACTEEFEYFYYPAFGVARGALPTIGCVFSMDESSNGQSGYMSYIDGLCGAESARINLLPHSGFRNADGSNIYGTRGCVINANDAIADGAGRHGIWAYSDTYINARRAYADNCGHQGTSADRGDGWDENRQPVGCGIAATRGSIINAEGSNALNAQGDCVCAYYGGIINIGNDQEQGTIAGGSINGLTYRSVGGTIYGVGRYGRHALVDDRLIGAAGYDKDHPGPKYLIAGNWDAGFFGEVTVEELFGEGNDSSWLMADEQLNITEGTAQYEDENWLKFAWKGKVLFYPKKSIRYHISWDHIYIKGCVYGTGDEISEAEQFMLDNAERDDGTIYKDWLESEEGVSRIPQTAQVEIGGKTFKVRLMRGINTDPGVGGFSRDEPVGIESEWNRLILPLYFQVKDYDWRRTIDGDDDHSDYCNTITPDWGVYYDDEDLMTHRDLGNGSYVWCQEFNDPSDDSTRRVVRGIAGAARLFVNSSWISNTLFGLRPVLVPSDG